MGVGETCDAVADGGVMSLSPKDASKGQGEGSGKESFKGEVRVAARQQLHLLDNWQRFAMFVIDCIILAAKRAGGANFVSYDSLIR